MSKGKKLLLVILVLVLMLSLAGCGEKKDNGTSAPSDATPTDTVEPVPSMEPTQSAVGNINNWSATELLANVAPFDPTKYYRMTIDIASAADIPTGTDTTGSTSKLEVIMKMDFEGDQSYLHLISGEFSMLSDGQGIKSTMEGWSDLASKISYSHMTADVGGEASDGGWTKAVDSEGGSEDILQSMQDMLATILACPRVSEPTKVADDTVQWKISAVEFQKIMAGLQGAADANISDTDNLPDFSVTAVFAQDGSGVRSLEAHSIDTEQTGKLIITVSDDTGSDKSVGPIPQEIINTAVKEEGGETGGTIGEHGNPVGTTPPVTSSSANEPAHDPAAYADTDALSNDGKGWCDLIDGRLLTNLPSTFSNDVFMARHYDNEVASFYWEHDSGGTWTGTLDLDHICRDQTWFDMNTDFQDSYDYCISEWGSRSRIEGGKTENLVVFGRETDEVTEVWILSKLTNAYVECHVVNAAGTTVEDTRLLAENMIKLLGLQ